MKKFVYVAVTLAAGIGALKLYDAYKKKEYLEETPVTLSEYLQTIKRNEEKETIPVPLYIVPEEKQPTIEIYNTQYVEPVVETQISYEFVNDEVYQHLVNANNQFQFLYRNGEVSSQMRNRGISISQGEEEYLDNNMRTLFHLISDYVRSYQASDFYTCQEIGRKIFEYPGIDKIYLYNLLVSRKLPVECQSGIQYFNYNSIYDQTGNILLNNGRLLHLIGGRDDIISNDTIATDPYNRMIQLSTWYEKLPTIIFDEYAPIRNIRGDDGVCYVWNQTMVERTCDNEWSSIKKEGQERYGFDASNAFVLWDADFVSYVYEDTYGQHYLLDDIQNARVDHIFEVQDAFIQGVGDVDALDNYVKNMRSYQDVYQYTR